MTSNTLKNEKNSTTLAWLVWSCGGLFYFYQFILRASPNVMAGELMRDFSIDACAFGFLAACYYYTYSLLQIPVGVMLDKIGPKRVLRAAILMCSCGAFLFSLSSELWMAAIGRTLIGAGAAGAFLGTVRLGSLWFPPHQLAVVVGMTVAVGKLGGISANLPLAFLVEQFNWRTAMLVLSAIGFSICCVVWLIVKDGPTDQLPHAHTEDSSHAMDFWPSFFYIIKNPAIWWISVYGCLMYVPLSAFADVWGVSFLMKVHNINKAGASGLVSLLFIGAGVGAPMIALFSDALRRRQLPMVLSAIFSLLVNGLLIFVPDLSVTASGVLLFLIGFGLTGQTLIFASSCEIMPTRLGGTVSGFVNMVVMLGGVVLQPLIGLILDWVWGGVKENGLPLYSLNDYRLALSTIPLCMLFSLLIVPFIPETHPRRKHPIPANEHLVNM